MKKTIISIIFTWMSCVVIGQLPSPTNFSVWIEYVEIGGMGWTDCGGKILNAPAYCTRFSWESPDTLNIESTLKHYNVYHNGTYAFSVDKNPTSYNYCGALTGKLHITAYYENPQGESDPSNIVELSDDLPIKIENVNKYDNAFAYYNQAANRIEFKNLRLKIKSITVFNLSGRPIVKLKNENTIRTQNFPKGFYLIEIRDSKNEIYKQKIFVN